MKAKETTKENLNITWFGHSAFLLKAPRGRSVLIDPWLENPKAPPGAKEITPAELKKRLPASLKKIVVELEPGRPVSFA
ncbi:MAG: MBL fold metallo-hydrolase [Ignavibacteria bacterium]|nr:MBL fold metallo-hydrolase [Ignavibacteria bacterium]